MLCSGNRMCMMEIFQLHFGSFITLLFLQHALLEKKVLTVESQHCISFPVGLVLTVPIQSDFFLSSIIFPTLEA